MSLSGNKGEWSELYALFKLLADGNLYVGDKDLNRIEDLFYPIVKILRSERSGEYQYIRDIAHILISDGSKDEPITIPITEFETQANRLLSKIKAERGTFIYPELDGFLERINCKSIKAKSSKKTDIHVVIYDTNVSRQSDLGFSIKSQLGGDSTLLNAGRTTNFIYRINGVAFTETKIDEINAIDSKSKIRDRISAIQIAGGQFEYIGMENDIFEGNLKMIESFLPNILADFLLNFNCGIASSIDVLTSNITESNPLKFKSRHPHEFYAYKINRFLTDIALGMMPNTVWDGKYDATGGYLVVKKDGEIVCYHIYKKNEFEDYLFYNTKLETASSSRHGFGVIYKDGGEYFFKLNLQIRFK
ncbi:HpaII family restriction endonuclease [Olivibacter sp. XZL3]|uniref:HpaII family restriction endonuclease n=1 Tax=Olivibacter sp. XZL3 TaxID=1735116 RepID=UPI0010659B17|nr:HpaII family restriction endonuclease [Olivibacter sp. XZL3]